MALSYRQIANVAKRLQNVPGIDTSVSDAIEAPAADYAPSLWQLTEDLDAGGDALANPCYYDQTTDNGDGTFGAWTPDTETEMTVADTTAQNWGLIGERIWCVPRARNNVLVMEARSHGAADHEGKFNDGALNAASSIAFSIYTCATGSWVDTTVNVTCYAPPRLSSGSIATGKWGRIYYELTRPGWTLDSAEC